LKVHSVPSAFDDHDRAAAGCGTKLLSKRINGSLWMFVTPASLYTLTKKSTVSKFKVLSKYTLYTWSATGAASSGRTLPFGNVSPAPLGTAVGSAGTAVASITDAAVGIAVASSAGAAVGSAAGAAPPHAVTSNAMTSASAQRAPLCVRVICELLNVKKP